MKTYNILLAQSILKDTQLLKEEIISSKGMFLYFLEQNKVFPPIEILLDSISAYSLRFLSTNYDLDNLEKEQKKLLDSYTLSDDNFKIKYTTVENITYSLSDLLHDLNNNIEIDNIKKSKLSLKFEYFEDHKEILLKLVNKSNELFINDTLLQQIFQKTTPNEVLSLGSEFLIKHPFIFNLNSKFLNNNELKEIYKKSIENYYLNEKSSGKKINIDDLVNYNFEAHDRDLLEHAIKNTYFATYDKLRQLKGATELITPWEFFEKFNDEYLTDFTSEDIQNHKDLIQKTWLENFKFGKEFKWHNFSQYFISASDFKEILTEDFLKELITTSQSFMFENVDSDVEEQKEKALYINFTATKILAKDPSMAQYIDLHSVTKNFLNLEEYHRRFLTKEYVQDVAAAIKNSAKPYINSNSIFDVEDFSPFMRSDIISTIVFELTEPSINNLYFLLNIAKKLKESKSFKHLNHTELNPFIRNMASKLDPIEVKKIGNYVQYPIKKKFLKFNLNNNLVLQKDFSYNVLHFEQEIFDNISKRTQIRLLYMDNNFREYVLKNNYNIMSPTSSKYEDVFTRIVGNVNSSNHVLFPFIKDYIAKNKDTILDNYFSLIAQHPIREELINLDTHAIDLNNYQKLIPALERQQQLQDIQSETYEKKKKAKSYNPYDTSKTEEEKAVSVELKDLEKTIENLNSVLSHNFRTDMINKCLREKNYNEAALFVNKNTNYIHLIYEHIYNLSFNELMIDLNDHSLVSFISENKKNTGNAYTGKQPHVKFNTHYSQEENQQLATKLLSLLKFKYDSENSNKVPHVLNYFEYEVKDFAKQFVILHDPVGMFYSHEYTPTNERKGKHIKEPFTNEEIIQGLNNLRNKLGNVFNYKDTNVQYDSMLVYNYENRENEYLDLLKSLEKDPVLYFFCSYSDIYNDFINFDKKDREFTYQNTFEARTAYLYDNLNLEVLQKGISQILYDTINDKTQDEVILKGLNDFIWRTEEHYADYDTNKEVYFHKMTEEESVSTLKIIWEKAPLYFISCNRLGAIKDVHSFIIENFEQFYHDKFIENFFLNTNHIISNSVSFTTDKSSYSEYDEKLHQLFEVACNYMLEHKKYKEIDMLVNIGEQIKFSENIGYGKKIPEYAATVAYQLAYQEQYLKFIKTGKQKSLLEEKIPLKVEKEVVKRKKI